MAMREAAIVSFVVVMMLIAAYFIYLRIDHPELTETQLLIYPFTH